MEYIVLYVGNIASLELAVNEAISKGWKLQGGLAIDKYGYGQAMVKDDGCIHHPASPIEPLARKHI
jgi:hypothetical protein